MNILKLKIEQGEYSLGQILVPQNFTKTAIKDGEMITQEVSITGRKFPLEDIRKSMLKRYTKYMRLTTDEEFANMELNEVQLKLRNLGKFSKKSETLEKKKIYGPFIWMGFNCLKARVTPGRQFTFYH